jgi:hypothetical protein
VPYLFGHHACPRCGTPAPRFPTLSQVTFLLVGTDLDSALATDLLGLDPTAAASSRSGRGYWQFDLAADYTDTSPEDLLTRMVDLLVPRLRAISQVLLCSPGSTASLTCFVTVDRDDIVDLSVSPKLLRRIASLGLPFVMNVSVLRDSPIARDN